MYDRYDAAPRNKSDNEHRIHDKRKASPIARSSRDDRSRTRHESQEYSDSKKSESYSTSEKANNSLRSVHTPPIIIPSPPLDAPIEIKSKPNEIQAKPEPTTNELYPPVKLDQNEEITILISEPTINSTPAIQPQYPTVEYDLSSYWANPSWYQYPLTQTTAAQSSLPPVYQQQIHMPPPQIVSHITQTAPLMHPVYAQQPTNHVPTSKSPN